MTDLIVKSDHRASRSSHAASTRWLPEARALAVLAAPLVMTQLAQMAIFTTDVVLLGRFSREALAAAAIGNTVFYFAWLIGSGPASAVSPMVAHSVGESRAHRAPVRTAVRMGLWSILLISLPMMGLMWWAKPILLALGQEPALAVNAGKFVAMLSFGLPFTLAFVVLRNFTTALGHPRAGLWVMAATVIFNALAGWVLIFGHLGAPRLGIVGSGLATTASEIFSFVAMLAIIQTAPDLGAFRIFRRFGRLAKAKLTEVFHLGMPIGMTMMFEAMLFNAMTLVMGTFGTVSVAAHQIAMSVASVTFMFPLGLGMATVVRVGTAAGRGDMVAARRSGLTAMVIAVVFITFCAAVMWLWGGPIAGLYIGGRTADDLAVIAMAAIFLKVAAAFQVFDALQVVAAQALRGLKDARMPMILAAGSYWLVGAPICLLLAFTAHMRGLGIWIGLATALAAAALAMTLRYWRLTHDRTPRPGSRMQEGTVVLSS